MKLTFTPSYATANTVRFDEVVTDSGDWLSRSEPMIGAQYIEPNTLKALGWTGTVGPEYEAPGRNGKTYSRRDVEGKSLTIEIKVV